MSLLQGKWIGQIFSQEVPSGTVNGSNVSFALSEAPHSPQAVLLMLNGLFLEQGTDYTISGTAITMTAAPVLGQKLFSFYIKG